MRIYKLLSQLPYPKSYLGKIFLVAFVGTHMPLLGLIVYLVASSVTGSVVVIGVLIVVLAATLAGATATLYVTYSLLVPVKAASEALREYREHGSSPQLPTHFTDKAGRLMSDVQETTDQLDEVIQSLEHLSTVDHLTNLPNRALFSKRLERALTLTTSEADGESRGEVSEDQTGRPAVLFLDLDNFKMVNDSLGHDAGDQLLIAVGKRIYQCVRSQDTIARFGGDEFTILLESATTQEVKGVAERIVENLQKPFAIGDREIVAGCSLGIAVTQETPVKESRLEAVERAGDLLRKADVALYQAKENGKGTHVMFEEDMDLQARERLEVEGELGRALERGEFVLHYQPIADLQTGEITGFETLLRWQHPRQGLLLPERFVHLAEESGLMISIGHWVLREACLRMRQWQKDYPHVPALNLNVNLSAKQFERPELVEEVERMLEETGLDPHLLRLEITESVAMSDSKVTGTVEGLRALGVGIVLDDFGTGYSSLGYLTRFPIDALKIDRSIVRGLDLEPKKAAITQAILTLANSLDYHVVAEGVETTGQLEHLRSLGCVSGQGNLFWEPQPAETALEIYLNTLEHPPTWARK